MSRRVNTLASLVRWRALGERVSADAHLRREGERQQADTVHQQGTEQLKQLQAERLAAPGGLLDLDRFAALSVLEEHASARVAESARALSHATEARDRAREAHALARAHEKLACTAHDAAVRAASHAAELRAFDQLSDLLAGGRP